MRSTAFFLKNIFFIEFFGQLAGENGAENTGDYADDDTGQYVGREGNDEVYAGKPHKYRKDVRRPAHTLIADHEYGGHRCEGGGGVTGGEALVALNVLPDQQPELVENAAIVRIRARPRYEHLKDAVREYCPDGDAEEHGRTETAGPFEQHQRDGQQDEDDAVMAKERDELEKRREEIACPEIEIMYCGSYALVKAREHGVDPERSCGSLHENSPFSFY